MTALPSWLAEPEQLFTYLRAQDFPIGTGEALRATALLDRLTQEGRAPQTSQEAARFLAPLLCTTAAQQSSLASVLRDFAEAREIEAKAPRLSLPLQERPSDFSTGPPSSRVPPRVLWIGFFIFVAVLTLVGVLWLGKGSPTTSEVSPGLSPSPTSVGLTYLTSGLTSLLVGLRYALLPWFAWLLFRRFRQGRAPALRRLKAGSGHVTALQPRSGEPLLFGDASLHSWLQALRAHRHVPTDQLDVVRSLRATIAAGGRPVIVYGTRPRLPDYPILVEQLTGKDHLAALGTAISARLASERLAFAVYQYSTDPRQLRDALRHPLTLADVAARHGEDMLLLVSDGDVLIDPVLGEVRPWIAEIAAWRNPVLLTPVPLQQWSLREQALITSGFIVLPATPAGLQALGEFLRRGEASRPAVSSSRGAPSLLARAGRRTLAWHHDLPPDPKERDELLDALTVSLPKSAFDLLCVLALFGEVRLDLTLAAGREMTSRDGKPLLNEMSFAALAWLPWFRLGRMPDWLRLDLAQCLDRRRLEQAHEFYKRWLTDLEAQRTDGEKLLVLPDRAFNRLLARLAGSESGRVIRDVLFLSFMRKEKLDALNLEAPQALTRLLRRDWADPTWITCGLCVILTGLAVLFAGQLDTVQTNFGLYAGRNSFGAVVPIYLLLLELVLWHIRALGVIPLNRFGRLFDPAIVAILVIVSLIATKPGEGGGFGHYFHTSFEGLLSELFIPGTAMVLALINSAPRGLPILRWSEPPRPSKPEILACAATLIGLSPSWVVPKSWWPIMLVTAFGTVGLARFVSRETGDSTVRVALFGWFGAVGATLLAWGIAGVLLAWAINPISPLGAPPPPPPPGTNLPAPPPPDTSWLIDGSDPWYYTTVIAMGLVYGIAIALWHHGRVRLGPVCGITLAFSCTTAALGLQDGPHWALLPLVPILPLYLFLVYLAVVWPHMLWTRTTAITSCAFVVVAIGAGFMIHGFGLENLIPVTVHSGYGILYDKSGRHLETFGPGIIAFCQTLFVPPTIHCQRLLTSRGTHRLARTFGYEVGYISAYPVAAGWRSLRAIAQTPGVIAVPMFWLLVIIPSPASGLVPGITYALPPGLGHDSARRDGQLYSGACFRFLPRSPCGTRSAPMRTLGLPSPLCWYSASMPNVSLAAPLYARTASRFGRLRPRS